MAWHGLNSSNVSLRRNGWFCEKVSHGVIEGRDIPPREREGRRVGVSGVDSFRRA